MKQKAVFLALVFLIIASTGVSGCGNKETTGSSEQRTARTGLVTKAYKEYFGTPRPLYPNMTYYVVFYPCSGKEPYLAGKIKPVAKVTEKQEDLPELAASELLNEPPLNEPSLARLTSPETELLFISIRDRTAIMDFSKELINSQAGTWQDSAIIASFASTLSQFEGIEKVSIKIEGESQGTIDGRKIEDFLGHISLLEQPFKPNKALVVTADQENAIATVKNFLRDLKEGSVYKYLSTATKKDVGTEAQFNKDKKSDLHKTLLAEHSSWMAPGVTDAKFEKNRAQVTITGNRTIDGATRTNDTVTLNLLKEKGVWRIDYSEDSEEAPPGKIEEDIITGPNNINRNQLEQIQAVVDEEQQQWRLDPQAVATTEGSIFGFDKKNDTFKLVSKTDAGQISGTGEALFEALHKGVTYQVFLMQPVKAGKGGIWTISFVKKK